MRDHYDFSKAVKNPYIGKLKQQITIRLDEQKFMSPKMSHFLGDVEAPGSNPGCPTLTGFRLRKPVFFICGTDAARYSR